MPGPSHAASVDLLTGRLDVVLELLRLAGVERPSFDYLNQATESLAPSQLGPFLLELVVRLMRRRSDGPPACVCVLVVEVQATFDAMKVRSWSLGAGEMSGGHKVEWGKPVDLAQVRLVEASQRLEGAKVRGTRPAGTHF